MKPDIKVIKADYLDNTQAADIARLLNAYASDPMGGGKALPAEIQATLCQELAKLPHAFSMIAYVDGKAAGLANCFEVFSTFACKPIINIHDVVVLESFRGRGIGRMLLESIEAHARTRGCCKLTLEVLSGNRVAAGLYNRFGFNRYELDPAMGSAEFWQKPL